MDEEGLESRKVNEVLDMIKKDGPLSSDQEDYCQSQCIKRYLRARGMNTSKAAKLLKATLNWRASIGIDSLKAAQFDDEISRGKMYIGGHDEAGHPVLVTRKKAETMAAGAHQLFLQYLVFTLEATVASMPPNVEQWVWIIDLAGYSRANSPPLSVSLATLRILSDHYPERLHKAYVVDAPTVFWFLWKILSPVLDAVTKDKITFVYSKDYQLDVTSASSQTSNREGSKSLPKAPGPVMSEGRNIIDDIRGDGVVNVQEPGERESHMPLNEERLNANSLNQEVEEHASDFSAYLHVYRTPFSKEKYEELLRSVGIQ